MAIELMEPVAAQIDPLRLTEFNRRTKIAREYGKRLNPELYESGKIQSLVDGYPIHGFVIDFQEANDLFKNVRKPTNSEYDLSMSIHDCIQPCREGIEGIVCNFDDFLRARFDISQDGSPDNLDDNQEYRGNGQPDNEEDSRNETAILA
ncbi:MAG: hypothetical protein F6K19_48870 [Cyanothece sp. SIO1E1]|nr:hypothetical protein [Cyanothece sp. SIO1E1]